MKKAKTILICLALVPLLLTGCAKAGLPKVTDTATSQAADEILKTLDELPKTQSSQTEVSDSDILIP
jgi:hypothetical protein